MPPIELSVRKRPVGGDVADAVSPAADRIALGSSRITLFIHGFNDTLADAQHFYPELLDRLQLGSLALGQVFFFFWPADKPWGFASGASYPVEIQPARDTAQRLFDFLAELQPPGGWPLEVQAICHSLGNRMLLELVKLWLAAPARPELSFRTCLMAAAVLVRHVEPGSQLADSVQALARSRVLYSKGDRVLQFAFPPGETLAGEGFFPSAVGRFGDPSKGVWGDRFDMQGIGHGDYWTSDECARRITELFGGTPPAAIAAAVLPERSTETRATADARALPERAIAARQL